jgi:nucleoside-triphosphatase
VLTKNNLLITGPPGIGKTTLIQNLSEILEDRRPVGFYTMEIRDRGVRTGFMLVSLDGRKEVLSHIEIQSPYRVGKYGVDIKGFEDFLESISFHDRSNDFIIIDEIGKMECFSEKFRTLMYRIMDSRKLVVATVALKCGRFISEVKKRDDMHLFEMTLKNRDQLLSQVMSRFQRDKRD